jgi:hypothetical protein
MAEFPQQATHDETAHANDLASGFQLTDRRQELQPCTSSQGARTMWPRVVETSGRLTDAEIFCDWFLMNRESLYRVLAVLGVSHDS